MFNPPSGVTNGAEYTYGNFVWQFSEASGVWNIKNGTLIGGQGPKGDQGDPGVPGALGNTGNTGTTGAGATGDSGAFIVGNNVGTVRITTVAGATGIASFDPRFFSFGTSGHIKVGGSLIGIGINDGKNTDYYGWGDAIEIRGTTGIDFDEIAKGEYKIVGLTATNSKIGLASFDSLYFTLSSTGTVDLAAAYQITGDTVQAGSAIAISASKVISSMGVTSFNGLTGAVTLTGDGQAIQGKVNNTITARVATDSLTGVASFNATRFTVNSGAVDLATAFQVTGDTVQAGSAIAISASKVISSMGVTSFNGVTGAIVVTGNQHGIPYINTSFRSVGGITASSAFVFDGTSLTFGTNSSNSIFTVTGPNMVLGAATQITGGVFRNPTEAAPHYSLGLGVNEIVVNGISGSIQRYTINPTAKVTIKAGTGWHAFTTATETIAVIIQQGNNKGFTGSFDSSILTDGAGSPILLGPDTSTNYGVTGGITVLTLMRVNKGSGAGLTMGFVISTGMTAPTASIN